MSRSRTIGAGVNISWLACILILGVAAQLPVDRKPSDSGKCESCHSEISSSYRKTPMANTSGPATEGLTAGEFSDKESAVHYRVFKRDGKVWMSYAREGKAALHGEKELEYYIGSGKKGHAYLFSKEGFWFRAPIGWYSQEGRWSMTAGYLDAQEIPLNLPAYVDCLNCHTSGLQIPVAGTDSKFVGKPFLHAGITCDRCHGNENSHDNGKGPIVNPAKLPPKLRDAICMECHFQGTVAVAQPGKHLYEFRPGERLSDYMHYFLFTEDPKLETARALSQFEALSQSTCKKSSGDKMWCGSCHDSHREPAAQEKPTYYRAKCLACHGKEFGAKHHPENLDCRVCHMPAFPSNEVTHAQGTDHRILRFPSEAPFPQLQVRGRPLTAFPSSDESLVTTRDYALAWKTLAQRGLEGAAQEAQNYLQKAVNENPEDATLLTALGSLEQRQQHDAQARDLYARALKLDPLANDAATNLGILEAKAGELRHAVELWQAAFARVPNRSAIGVNLAVVFCATQQREMARKYLDRVLEFNPDYRNAKTLMENLDKDPPQCKP